MKLSEFLQRANSEDNGNPSSMRVNTFVVTMEFATVMAFGFVWVVIVHPELVLAYAGMLLATIMGALGLKGWQKGNEEKPPTP